jgi:PAS domain S-box-containing protein
MDDMTGQEPGEFKKNLERSCLNNVLLDDIPAQIWYQADAETYGAVNNAHARFMGRPKEALEGKKLVEVLSKEEAEACIKANEGIFKTGKPVTGEEWVKNAGGERRLLSINKTPKLSAAGEAEYLVCVALDITEKAVAEEGLKYRDRFEKLMADISARFINLPPEEIDGWINSALRLIGELELVDRSYVFRFSETGDLMTNTHEWCAPGVEPQIANLKDIPAEALPWWMLKLKANEDVNIPSVAGLPPEARAEREILEPQGIRSLLVVPINIEGRVEGFLGFDSVKTARTWSPDSVVLVRMAASIMANALSRKKAEESRREYESVLRDVTSALTNRSADYSANVKNLTSLAGWMLRGDMARYNRVEGNLLCAIGKWNTPEGYRDIDKPTGHICYDLITSHGEDLLYIPDLASTRYSETDPVVKRYGYKTYIGYKVKGPSGAPVGALSLVYKEPHKVTSIQTIALALLAQALGSEEYRREATEKLEESEARWQFAIEGAGDGMWDWDAQTNKVFFSWRWKEMLGFSGAEIGDSLDEWTKRVHPEDLPAAMEAVQKHLEGKTLSYTSEHRMKCKDGSYKWILDRGKVVSRATDGKPHRVIGTHSDISERKRMETELKEAVAKLTALMENMQAGLLVETPERRVMFTNHKFCEIFSIPAPPEALIGADCAAAAEQSKVLMSDPEGFITGVLEKMKDGKPVMGTELSLKDGRVFSQDYVPISLNDGRFVGHMWKYNDITPQKKLEQMRAEVTHHVNHELRRPLTNQILALDYLSEEIGKTLTSEQAKILGSALSAAQGMTRMVEDLLDVTRSETGKLSIQPEKTDLAALAADIVTGMAPLARDRGISLELEPPAGLPPVNADPARVRQVLGNLIDNAFKFTPAGGLVKLSLRSAPDAAGMVEISVSDTGQGMEKADLEKIFDRLYQTENISRKGMKGLGLGLHICKMLVERQGGRIWVESEKGKGSVFRFTLPC